MCVPLAGKILVTPLPTACCDETHIFLLSSDVAATLVDFWRAKANKIKNKDGWPNFSKGVQNRHQDMHVGFLSCFHSLWRLKFGLRELVKKIFRCCMKIDVTTLPYDMALKMCSKNCLRCLSSLISNRCRKREARLVFSDFF